MTGIIKNTIIIMCLLISFAFADSGNKINAYNKDFVFPAIISISGTKLNKYEKQFIKEVNPYGVLLLANNIKSKEQLKNLRSEIEELTNRRIIFFVDQEGGRVNRLKNVFPNHNYPAPYYFNNIATTNLKESKKMVYANAIQTAKDLKELDIDVNLGLILDVVTNKDSLSDKSDVTSSKSAKFDIGDRSFSENPKVVRALAQEQIRAFNEVGVDLCAKHFLGLGSSSVNTHNQMSVINKNLNELNKTELLPFRNLKNVKYGLLAHAIYPAIDAENPAPFSPKVVSFIRNNLKFNGILISDALNMGALSDYTLKEKIEGVLNNNVDLVLIMEPMLNEQQLNTLLSTVLDIKSNLIKNGNFSKRI